MGPLYNDSPGDLASSADSFEHVKGGLKHHFVGGLFELNNYGRFI